MTDEAVIELRLKQARSELTYVSHYQYAIVNDVLDTAAAELRSIVLQARGEPDGVSLTACCITKELPDRLQGVLSRFTGL